MPFKSLKQERYFNANRSKLEKQGVNVDEWNKASKGMFKKKETKAEQKKDKKMGVKENKVEKKEYLKKGLKAKAGKVFGSKMFIKK